MTRQISSFDDLRAGELLNALPEDQNQEDEDSPMLNTDPPVSSYRLLSTSYEDPKEAALEAREAPRYLLAKAFFDMKEFDRCAGVFLPHKIAEGALLDFDTGKGRAPTSTPKAKQKARQSEQTLTNPFPRLSQKSLFLALYARYISGEKRRDEETEMVLGPADGGHTVNRELPALARGLQAYFGATDVDDPDLKRSQGWLEYLYGCILARSSQEDLAQQWLLRSVRLNPFHWGAWEELSSLLSDVDDLTQQIHPSRAPQNLMTLIYSTYASVDLFPTTDTEVAFKNLNALLSLFPTSTFLQTQLAMSHYHAKDFDTAAIIFKDLLKNNPYRLDSLDHYSNILYVMNDRPSLAFLAQIATNIDKFRPETCCVVGNYYSLCSQHEKAVMYFRRALTLDRRFLSAWTLMGHEYIELKNTHAAIESYRRAVDVNRRDYRAWYGLGQAYEMLDMGIYALYYYKRAAGLRPYDAKMWQAVGSCYAKMDRLEQSIKALKRALVAGTYYETDSPGVSFNTSVTSATGDRRKATNPAGRKLLDPEILFQIASLYERMGDEGQAADTMQACVNQETGVGSEMVSRVEKDRKKRQLRDDRAAQIDARRHQHHPDSNAEDTGNDDGDGDTEILSPSSYFQANNSPPHPEYPSATTSHPDPTVPANSTFGTGTTATTSKARLWLARFALRTSDLERAERLAEELCMDGYEVEEAKGLVREVRGRREAAAASRAMGNMGRMMQRDKGGVRNTGGPREDEGGARRSRRAGAGPTGSPGAR